jgi:hypothetical protein
MKKILELFMAISLLFLYTIIAPASAEDPTVTDLKDKINELGFAGGVSAGEFYASNPGKDTSDNEFLLSNLLLEISSSVEELPVNFVAAFGQTSTPSLLDSPETNDDFKIEYASLTLNPNNNISLEGGLLQPNAGFENTYTYNNINIILGAVASQQPYNAYGARLAYDMKGFNFYGGFYKKRLDNEEYEANGSFPGNSWEIGLGGSILDNDFIVYHYHINGLRSLTGAVIERTINNLYIALNVDYWRWNSGMKEFFQGDSSIGGTIYLKPRFGNFSVPLRLEYIDQGESCMYSENPDTKRIYSVTLSPTYHLNENAYIRVESAYISGDRAFADKQDNIKDNRISLAAEIGYLF